MVHLVKRPHILGVHHILSMRRSRERSKHRPLVELVTVIPPHRASRYPSWTCAVITMRSMERARQIEDPLHHVAMTDDVLRFCRTCLSPNGAHPSRLLMILRAHGMVRRGSALTPHHPYCNRLTPPPSPATLALRREGCEPVPATWTGDVYCSRW